MYGQGKRMIRETETAGGVLGISPAEADPAEATGVKIEYYRGKDVGVKVPGQIEGKPVTGIGKKAFLGAKTLTRIELPGSIRSIGDWAFASCSALRELIIPKREMTLGSGLFKDCEKLERIVFIEKDEDGEPKEDTHQAEAPDGDVSYLLALAVSKMDAPYLFDTQKAGSEDWIAHFDSLILQILEKDDTDGFSKMLLCGEEDYVGDESNLDTFILMKKKEKVRILLARLLHPYGLSEKNREICSKYLSENMSSVTWPLVLDEHGDEKEYFDILIDTGCITDSNITGLIDSMGERNTQMKGYLIRHKGESSAGGFLNTLEL